MPQEKVQPAAPPQPPDIQVTAPSAPAAAMIGGREVAVPVTRRDVQALESRRSELSRQLNSAVGRRTRVAEELRDATGSAREGLEGRLAVLDQRIMQLEADIAENGRLLSSAPSTAIAGSANRDFGPLSSQQITGISIVFIIFVLAPLMFTLARAVFRRSSTEVGKAFVSDATQRLNRLEQAVDTIAVEIERISEGQRFVTKVLANPDAVRQRLGEADAGSARARSDY
jgi:hypothetical protein